MSGGGVPVELTDASFDADVLERTEPVLVDFWAPWCGPCKRLDPAVQKIAETYAGRVAVGKLNVDDNPRTADRYDVLSLPTLILFRDGTELARLHGRVRPRDIEDALIAHTS